MKKHICTRCRTVVEVRVGHFWKCQKCHRNDYDDSKNPADNAVNEGIAVPSPTVKKKKKHISEAK
jgi:ribosomal protein L37AE/L43A